MEAGGERGAEAVCETCFRVSLKHARLWGEIFQAREKKVCFGVRGLTLFFFKNAG